MRRGPDPRRQASTSHWLSTSGPPQGCAITPADQSLGSAGGAITQLTVACAGGTQPLTSFTWTHSGAGCGASFTPSSTKNQGETLPSNTTTGYVACQYNVTVDNGSGTPAVATAANVTVNPTSVAIDLQAGGVANKTLVQNIPWVDRHRHQPDRGVRRPAGPQVRRAYVGVIKVPATATPSATVVGKGRSIRVSSTMPTAAG